jgi:hypothetical protein
MTPEIVQGIARAEAMRIIVNKQNLSAQTTDATPVLLFSIDTEPNERGKVTYTVEAMQDDGITGMSLKRIFSYKNDGTTLSVMTGTELFSDNEFTTADVSESVNVNALEVYATGETTTNIFWIGSYEQEKIKVEVFLP